MSEVGTLPPHDLGIPHRLVASNTHLKHKPSKWGYLEYDHMSHKCVGGGGSTYMGNHARNKTRFEFPRGKKTASKKAVMSRKI